MMASHDAPGAWEAGDPGREAASAGAGALAWLDRALGIVSEWPAMLLVLAEVCVLLSGVVARYVFHEPIVWSDELAAILFLWLSMLGAVIALRRGAHMRMTALVSRCAPGTRLFLDAFALAAALVFLALLLMPAWEYAAEEAVIVTPAMEISNAWRASALPVGTVLMLAVCVVRLLRCGPAGKVLPAVLAAVGLALAFWLMGPLLMPLGKLNLVIFFAGVVGACVFAGVPIAFSFALATFGFLALTTRTPMVVLAGRLDEGMSHLILLAVPLFVLLGMLIEMTGMARAMVQFLASLLGHVRGGLNYVLIGGMHLVSGISGSKTADMAAIAPVLLPEMKKRGAKPGDLIALLSTTGAQTETIPPSIVLITIGSVTGVSISALFTGGMLAGLLLYRQFDFSRLPAILVETATLSGAILFIIGCATGMAWALTQSGFAHDLAEAMTGLPGGKYTFMAVSLVVFIVLGSVLEGIPAIVLFGPLMFPIARAVGIHEVQYAMVVVLAMGVGLFAPPFGVGYYGACAVGKVDPEEGVGPIWGYMSALIVGLILVAAIPWISIGFLDS